MISFIKLPQLCSLVSGTMFYCLIACVMEEEIKAKDMLGSHNGLIP